MNPRSARAQKKGYIVIFVVVDSDVDIAALGGRSLVGIGCRNGYKWCHDKGGAKSCRDDGGRAFLHGWLLNLAFDSYSMSPPSALYPLYSAYFFNKARGSSSPSDKPMMFP